MNFKKILVVDDDEEILQLVDQKLVAAGYPVISVKTGREAVYKAKDISPGLILMDIVLPDIDGAEAVKELQDDPITKGIPVIFLSGIVTKEEGEEKPGVTVGGTRYPALGKPFSAQELLAMVKMYI